MDRAGANPEGLEPLLASGRVGMIYLTPLHQYPTTVTLSQAAVTPVTVALTYSGTATDGSDYTRVVNVTVPAGATSATFDLTTLDDALADNGETIVVGLGSISGGGFEAISANPAASSVTTTISDDVTPGGPGTPAPGAGGAGPGGGNGWLARGGGKGL